MPDFTKFLGFYFVGLIAINAFQYRPRNAEELAITWIASTHHAIFSIAPLALLVIIILIVIGQDR